MHHDFWVDGYDYLSRFRVHISYPVSQATAIVPETYNERQALQGEFKRQLIVQLFALIV
jgi:hypothetical protein